MFDKKEYAKQYRIKHKEIKSRYAKKYNQEHREKILKQMKKYNQEHKGIISAYKKKYNKEHRKEYNEQTRNRRRIDLKCNLNHKISREIYKSLKKGKNRRHWENIVGYTLVDLIKHLKQTMPKGYDWQDYLDGRLHIDHKIPITVFNFTKPEHADFKRCWALKNLQLLPAKENLIKQDKLSKPFQPALAI